MFEFYLSYFDRGRVVSKTVGYYTLKLIFLFSVICMYLVLLVCALYVYSNGVGVFLCGTYAFCLSCKVGFV